MNTKELFIKAVEAARDVPEFIRAHAREVGEVREGKVTQSYLDFLGREGIRNPRGIEWENVMKQRHAHMLPHLGASYAAGLIRCEGCSYYVMIDSENRNAIYWEKF